jgi:hypothetical protein
VRRLIAPTAAGLLVALAALPAFSQDVTQARPFDGVFAGSAAASSATHSLDASVSASGAYEVDDGDVFTTTPVSIFETARTHQDLSTLLTYRWQGRRVQLGATAGANAMYFNTERRFVRVNDYGAFGLSATLGRRAQVFANQSASCGPLHFQRLFPSGGTPVPGAVPTLGVDYSFDEMRACTFDTSASVTYGLRPRTSMEFQTGIRRSEFSTGSGLRPLQWYSVGGRLVHNVSRNTRVRLGYTQNRGEYGLVGAGAATTVHNLDIGFDSGRSLSLSRRTFVEVSVGSTVMSSPGATAVRDDLEYRIVGSATLNHEMGRTWRARAGYSRGVHFIDGFAAPAFIDSLNTTLTGFLGRRVELAALGGVSTGDIHVHSGANLRAYTGSGRLRIALARAWAVFGEYTYYSYELPTSGVVAGVPHSLDRQTARVGLTWWLPLLRK